MNLRLCAAKALTRVLADGEFLTAALEQVLDPVQSAQDRALVKALCYGVCRYYHRLDFILGRLLDRPIKETSIRLLMLVGLYQLAFMRIKTHAAVAETVGGAARKPWAKGLINAVLRRYLREKDQLETMADADLSASLSHPLWLIDKIRLDWPELAELCLRENNLQPPLTLRVNLAQISRETYCESLNRQGISATTVEICPSALILEKPLPVEKIPGFAEGLVSVQDLAPQLAAGLLELESGNRVLDMCAAPGGKTAHILEMRNDLQEVVAVDIDAVRMQRVADNLQRSRLFATTIVGDAAKPDEWWDGRLFDRILVDAPCSALGVVRRHPDIKLIRRPEDVEPLKRQQRAILQAAWSLLAPGGRMLYATCSILKEENERPMLEFLAARDDAFELPIIVPWGIKTAVGRQILTGDSGMDGFYYALIGKA